MGWKNYFSSLWNIVDLASSALNLAILLRYDLASEAVNKSMMIPFAVLLMWFKVFYIIRIFNKPALYMNLLLITIKDIGEFILIFFLALATTANMFFIVS